MRPIFFSFITLTLLLGCQKEENKNPYVGEASALKNGELWEAYTWYSTFRKDSNEIDLIVAVADKDNIVREELQFLNLPLIEGKHLLDTMSPQIFLINFGVFYITSVADGDVTGDTFYSPGMNPENYVIVDSYDTVTNELVGRFNTFLVLGPWRPKFDQSLPDTLRFEDGRFNIKIKKE
jgi:hypothetical protein